MPGKKDRKEKEYVKTYNGPGPSPPVAEDDILSWLEELVKNNQIEIFSIQINKRTVLLDDEKERIVITRKGATLKRIEEFSKGIRREKDLLIKDVKRGTKYILDTHFSEGLAFKLDPRFNEIMVFKKITGDLDLWKIKESSSCYSSSLELPKEVVIVEKLRVAICYKENKISLWGNKYLIDDELFKRIRDFIDGRVKQIDSISITERSF